MSEFLCIDGPLAGVTLVLVEPQATGSEVVIEVVDVGQAPECVPRYTYVVESRSAECQAGRLRFLDLVVREAEPPTAGPRRSAPVGVLAP